MHSQVLLNGLVSGTAYGLVAASFSLICHTGRFFHLAHGATYTVTAYLALAMLTALHLPVFLAIGLAVLAAAALGGGMYLVVYRPLQHRGSPPAVLLLASLGLLIVLQSGVSMIFGDATQKLRTGSTQLGFETLGARLTPIQGLTILSSVLLTTLLWLWVQNSRSGKLLRALANDQELSRVVGVNTDRMMLLAFIVGSFLAGIAAVLAGFDTDLTPMMGFRAILIGVVAAILGGVGSVLGAFLGGVLLGCVQQWAVWTFPGEWQDTVVFALLILLLVVRPQGLLGKPIGRATV